MKNKTLGFLIADIDEYVRIYDKFGDDLTPCDEFSGLTAHKVRLDNGNELITLCSGVGKVNAAVGALLLAEKCDIILNAGLSGGFGNVSKYDLVVGTGYSEHDFDLTLIGYPLGKKPGEEIIFPADGELFDDIVAKFPFIKKGLLATGDCFVSSAEQHNKIESSFSPLACDMESAAMAHAVARAGKRFLSLRLISDGADGESETVYRDTLVTDRSSAWLDIGLEWLKTL